MNALFLTIALTAIPWMVVIGLVVYIQRERHAEPGDEKQETRFQRWEKELLMQIEEWREGR